MTNSFSTVIVSRSVFSGCHSLGRAITVACTSCLLGTLLFSTGCGGSSDSHLSTSADQPTLVLPGVIVEATWVAEQHAANQLMIIDAREPEEFAAGHLLGAVNIPPSRLLNPDPQHNRDMAPTTVIQQVFSENGITMDRPVVVYDGESYREAARVFWVLEVHGHPRVAVLNGGYVQWVERGYPVTTVVADIVRTQFIANVQPERLATKVTVLRAIEDDSAVILDSRSEGEFRGLNSKANRKGHIPSAVDIDFKHNLVFNDKAACSLKLTHDLIALYRDDLQGKSKVITYCNSGNRASVSYLALRAAGYNAAVYDGSWLEWGNNSELPIE